MQKPSNLILLVDVPSEPAQKIQRLANSLDVEVLIISVADSLPVANVPAVPTRKRQKSNAGSSNAFQVIEPEYNCVTDEVTFLSINGSGVEYMAPGVTGWTTNPGPHRVDMPVAKDSTHLTIYARMNGVEADPYQFGFRDYCAKKST
jgi:hypothetical protein